MTLPDGLILFVFILSAGLGLARGFAREFIGLIGLVVGIALGAVLAPGLGGSVFSWIPGPLAHAGAFVTVFLVVLLASALLGRLVTSAIDAASLSLPNRLLGALFGLAKAALFLVVLLVALDLIGVDSAPWLKGSRLGEPAWKAAQAVRHGFRWSRVSEPSQSDPPTRSTI